jgi:hypothetical protein
MAAVRQPSLPPRRTEGQRTTWANAPASSTKRSKRRLTRIVAGLHRDLTEVHRRALGHVLEALGMKPLKPQDAVLICGVCGDETLVVCRETGICLCLACMEACNGAALPSLLKGEPPTPERRLVNSYLRTFEVLPLGNAKEMTRRLAECCVLDEMRGDEV